MERLGLHVLLAALPLLAISAHVFGLVRMQLTAALVVIPLAVGLVALAVFAPHAVDRIIAHGLGWGVVACVAYDAFRLDTVHMLGLWGDFIPTMGTWITGSSDQVGGAVVGYLWRFVGDGGGIGVTYFVGASALGLQRFSRRTVVLTAVAFAVFPVWAGLIATVALAPDGERLMFPLTPMTLFLSLVGHLIFGLILGLGFWRSGAVQAHWPWEPVLDPRRPVSVRGLLAAVRSTAAGSGRSPVARRAPAGPPGTAFVPAQRTAPAPPAARTLDPDTWAQWQRQIETTRPGRRVHGSRRPAGRK